MNNCGTGAKIKLTFRFREIATPNKSARNDKVLGCARNENLFGAFLYTECAISKTKFRAARRRAFERRT